MLKNKKNLSKLFIILGVFLALLVGIGIFGLVAVYNPAKTLLASVRQMETIGTETLPFVKSQDLEGIKNQLVKVRTQTDVIEKNLKVFAWSQSLPVAKDYYQDGVSAIAAGKEVISAAEILKVFCLTGFGSIKCSSSFGIIWLDFESSGGDKQSASEPAVLTVLLCGTF